MTNFEQAHLFTSGQEDYHTFRIPALAITTQGTILAFAEGRKQGRGDAGEIDLVLKRSFDNGESWEPLQLLVTEADMTCGTSLYNGLARLTLPRCNFAHVHAGFSISTKFLNEP